MALPQPRPRFGFDDYLQWEAAQTERHEFIDGEVFAMTGARGTHNTIALNIAMALRQALRGTPCRTHIESMKLRVVAADASLYPDVMVSCDPVDLGPEAELFKTAPRLVVEVLSEGTAAFDRGRKFALYRQLPSLQEYLLVEQDRRSVELFRRNAEGLWVLHTVAEGQSLQLASLGVTLTLAQVYEDTVLADGVDRAAQAEPTPPAPPADTAGTPVAAQAAPADAPPAAPPT